jgi:hypothetical protein
MAKYKITTEDGKSYLVEVPDGAPPPTIADVQALLASQAAESRPGKKPDMVEGAMGALGQGMSMGWADEIGARLDQGLNWATNKLFGGNKYSTDYDQLLAQDREKQKRFAEEYPVANVGLQVAGALPTALIPALAPARGATMGRAALNAAKAGAAAGAVSGAGTSEGGVGSRIAGAGKGAALGGALGALFSGGAHLMGRGAQGTVDALADTQAGQQLGRLPGVTPPGPQRGAEKVLEAMDRDGLNPAAMRDRLREMGATGKPVVLADLGRENVRGLADAAMIPPTAARAGAAEMLVERAADAGARVGDDLAQVTGLSGTAMQASERLQALRTANAAPLYEAAYRAGANGVDDPVILSFLQRPAFRAALAKARTTAANEGRSFPNILDDQGRLVDIPDVQALDQIKRAIDGVLYTEKRAGLDPASWRAIKDAQNAFVARLDEIVPGYRQARAEWAGPTRMMEAVDAGQEFARQSAEEVQALLSREFTSPAEREHYLLGAVDYIRKTIASSPDGADIYRRVFGSDMKRKQLQALFPDPKQFQEFARRMSVEKQMRVTADTIRGNSKTASRQVALDDLGTDPFLSTLPQLATGNFTAPLGQLLASRARGTVGANAEAVVPLLLGDPKKALAQIRLADKVRRQMAGKPVRSAAPLGNVSGLLSQ